MSQERSPEPGEESGGSSILASSAVMAAGTTSSDTSSTARTTPSRRWKWALRSFTSSTTGVSSGRGPPGASLRWLGASSVSVIVRRDPLRHASRPP